MESKQEPPLDEIQWRSPEAVQEMGGIQTNTVLPYFSRSPFFDVTSNNATLTTQAMYNQNMFYIIQTREAFEGRLRTMQGLEFMVTHDPSDSGTKHDHNGVWVIRKQNRRKKSGLQDEITGISSYFVVWENIYMAPSVGSIIGSRMLSTVTSLTKLLSTVSTLSDFTPALGHTYLPPSLKNQQTPGSSFQMTQTSKDVTPMPGGSTPKPETQDTSSTKASTASKLTSDTEYEDSQMLATSFDLLLRYGNEYMDENPTMGEPGNFKLSKSRDSGLSTSMPESASANQPFKISTTANKVSPPQLKTDVSPEPIKKGSTGSSKSPITPGTKDKKTRRKSKAAGAGGVSTPKVSTPQTGTPK